MTPNKRDLKSFARFDGTGRIVPGSLVLRRSKPKVGNWKEIPAYECCNQNQVSVRVQVTDAFPFSYPDFVLQGNGGSDAYLYGYGSVSSVTNINELVNALNHDFSYYGKFSVKEDGYIWLQVSEAMASILTASGATSMNAYTFAD